MRYMITLFVCGIYTLSGVAYAQALAATVTLTPTAVVSPQNPDVWVDLNFTFTPDPNYTGFAAMNFDISVTDGEWTSARSASWEYLQLTFPPSAAFPSQSLTDVWAWAWPQLGISSKLADFKWTTDDFTPRTVDTSFVVNGLPTLYLAGGGTGPVSSVTVFTTSIQIIPAPTTSLAYLAAASAVGMRRRR